MWVSRRDDTLLYSFFVYLFITCSFFFLHLSAVHQSFCPHAADPTTAIYCLQQTAQCTWPWNCSESSHGQVCVTGLHRVETILHSGRMDSMASRGNRKIKAHFTNENMNITTQMLKKNIILLTCRYNLSHTFMEFVWIKAVVIIHFEYFCDELL